MDGPGEKGESTGFCCLLGGGGGRFLPDLVKVVWGSNREEANAAPPIYPCPRSDGHDRTGVVVLEKKGWGKLFPLFMDVSFFTRTSCMEHEKNSFSSKVIIVKRTKRCKSETKEEKGKSQHPSAKKQISDQVDGQSEGMMLPELYVRYD